MHQRLPSPSAAQEHGTTDQVLQTVFQSFTPQSQELELALHFSQILQVEKFELGDELTQHQGVELPKEQSGTGQNELFLVCQGRVRLVLWDAQQQRDIAAMVLEMGDTFGGDRLFCDTPLAYRAIAAGSGQIAQVTTDQLTQWLPQLPTLQTYLTQQALERQRLLFFKALTPLRSLPSHLLRQFVSHLSELRVTAGSSLNDVTSPSSGHFWLRSGQIQGEQTASLIPGSHWGDLQTTSPDWLAATDVQIYHLPCEAQEAAQAIAPAIAELLSPSSTSADTIARQNGHLPPAPTPLRSPNRQPRRNRLTVESTTSTPTTQPQKISFPRPSRQRFRGRKRWGRYPFVQQQSSSDCGAACLSMISRYWGKTLSLNWLRNIAGVGRSGASLKGLATAAESIGFHTRPVRASLGALVEQKNPWIAHWQGDHYIVVYRAKGRRIIVADPALGRRSLSHQEFQSHWTGYALLLEPTEKLSETKVEKPSFNRFLSLLLPYRSLLLQIILASLLIQVFGLVTPLFTQIILDQVVVQKSLFTLHVFAIGLVIFGVWSVGLSAIRQYLLDYFSNRLDLTLISSFVSHALMLPLKFFESRHVGDVITRVQENQKIQMFLTRQAITAWLDALMMFVYLGLMLYYNWRLTLLVLGMIPPILILVLVATPLLRQISREIFNREAAENSTLVEILTGIATVKAAAAERDLRWGWEERLTSMLNARFQGQKLSNTLQATSGLINTLGSTALLWFGASLVIQDQLTIGQFVAFNMLIGNVISPILRLVGLWDEFQEVIVSVERLDDVFSSEPEETPQKPLLLLPSLRGDVQLENVTFRYNEDQETNTLQNISFQISAGQTIAIVGRSGSGKTTLVSLLQGLYHPTSGRIWMDGHDIRHVSPHSLRSQLGVVLQECFLFSGTILENLTLYRPNYTLEQVVEVAKLAEAHTFIQALPLGYHTKVGERGATLSGGQRQRIAIARALLGNPRILILDEATSSLDTESERRFQQNLARISRDRTTFIIAHRLSTVRHADCILVIDRGVLVEQGTHAELIALQGLYYHLAQQQLDL